MTVTALGAEFRRSLRLARSYWLEYVADLILYILGFLLLSAVFQAASPNYGRAGMLSTLIGYTTWKICASVLEDIARVASDEARTGTLEQLFLAGLAPGLVFAERSLGFVLSHTIRGFILAFVLAGLLGLLQPASPVAAALFILTLLGACGLGFALAGLTLVYKRIGGGLHLLWQMLVFFTGALAPITHPMLGGFAKLLPLTWGISALRANILDGVSSVELWQSGLWQGLLINTLIYLILGVVLFNWGERCARQQGVLAHY